MIVDLTGKSPKDAGTVGDFLRLPNGRDRITRLFNEGRIGFRDANAKVVLPQRVVWSGAASPREVLPTGFRVNKSVYKTGLIKNEEDALRFTQAMTSGAPPSERLKVHWRTDEYGRVVMKAESPGGVYIDRTFTKEPGGWVVTHDYFAIPKQYQGGGYAGRMMRSSVEVYDEMGVKRIDVHANIDVGGYSWAKLGFAANKASAKEVRADVRLGFKYKQTERMTAFKSLVDSSSDDELMYNVARFRPDGVDVGKKFLLGWDWHGSLNLADNAHRSRLNSNFK